MLIEKSICYCGQSGVGKYGKKQYHQQVIISRLQNISI